MRWDNGLNFGQAKYKILSSDTFIPHIRSSWNAAIPFPILRTFVKQYSDDLVALLNIMDKESRESVIRIKKLSREGESLVFSYKKESNFKDPIVKVLSIKPLRKTLERTQLTEKETIPILSILPTHTFTHSFPYQNSTEITPIYAFELGERVIAGCYLGRKDITFMKEVEPNDLTSLVIGLYFAEGGKTQASFTNSQPTMINIILDFLEQVSDFRRENLTASIYCHPKLKEKKKNLEEFWTSQVGIYNFYKNLHLGKNSKSPCGTLELYLSSIILKEFLCGLMEMVYMNPFLIDPKNIIRGIFSGDGSPTQQTKTFLTHHITMDRNNWKMQFDFINKFISQLGIQISTVPAKPRAIKEQIHAVVYGNWITNLKLLFLDVYKFNLFNREKFASQLLSLKKTKLFLELEDGLIVKGKDIVHDCRPVIRFRDFGLIELVQINPKPNRKYEVHFTDNGSNVKDILQNFISKVYPRYQSDVENFYRLLEKFELFERGDKDESILRPTHP